MQHACGWGNNIIDGEQLPVACTLSNLLRCCWCRLLMPLLLLMLLLLLTGRGTCTGPRSADDVHAHCVFTKTFRILFGVLKRLTSADVGTGVSGLYAVS
jgi:hypothetical protein